MSKQKNSPFFEIDARTIDGLIRMDLLHPSERRDPDAVFKAVKLALRNYIGPDVSVLVTEECTKPHEVSIGAQQLYNDLVLQELLVIQVKSGLMSATSAVSVMDAVVVRAKQMKASEATIQSAMFGRQALAWELHQEGLI